MDMYDFVTRSKFFIGPTSGKIFLIYYDRCTYNVDSVNHTFEIIDPETVYLDINFPTQRIIDIVDMYERGYHNGSTIPEMSAELAAKLEDIILRIAYDRGRNFAVAHLDLFPME